MANPPVDQAQDYIGAIYTVEAQIRKKKLAGDAKRDYATFRMHDINPYDYFVDVLQRISQHPASLVHQLTPRVWK